MFAAFSHKAAVCESTFCPPAVQNEMSAPDTFVINLVGYGDSYKNQTVYFSLSFCQICRFSPLSKNFDYKNMLK